jgi:hypothetical protein
MTTQNVPEISLDELAITLESYAGPAQPRRLPVRRRRWPWRFAWAAAALVLVFVGVAYAAGFNPFPGISAANHPATSNDALPASLTAHIAEFSAGMERFGHGRLLPDTARFIAEFPSGMRFYTIATSAGGLCLATVDHPCSIAKGGGVECGDSLSRSRPITIASEQVNHSTPRVSYGLALDGVTAVSFTAGGAETIVAVKDNVWAYEGHANLRAITVHWENGSTQTLIDGR